MKTLYKILALTLSAAALSSCYEGYVDDYDYPNMGFTLPRQVRTVMSKTNRIYVGVSIGGKRAVDLNDWGQFTFDESLLAGTGFKMLPENYYVLSDPAMFKVRKTSLAVADVEITFTDAFFADPAARSRTYALPFRLVASSIDAADAEGNVSEYGAIRSGAETAVVVVKYASSYSGTYYRMGQVVEVDASGNSVAEAEVYSEKEVMRNGTVSLSTAGPSTVTFSGLGNGKTSGTVTLAVDPSKNLDEDASVEITSDVTIVSASAKWVRNGNTFFYNGDRPAPQFELDYTYTADGKTYHVTETLVLRKWAEEELRVETF